MGGFTKKKVHIRCRRCGKNSLHKRHHQCASCGFPEAKRRKYSWIKWYTQMQEIVLIAQFNSRCCYSSCCKKNASDDDKNQLLSLGASSHIKTQINSLKIEKDILTKTISRLYQSEDEFSKIQKDKLLLRYQHQLGIILAKLEKLEQASKHPDLGPVGDGLISLMDQKLSKLDDRLYDLSSKYQMQKFRHLK